MQLRSPDLIGKQGQDGCVATIPFSDFEKDNPGLGKIFKHRQTDHVPVEGCHRREVRAPNGDLTKGFDGDGVMFDQSETLRGFYRQVRYTSHIKTIQPVLTLFGCGVFTCDVTKHSMLGDSLTLNYLRIVRRTI